MDLKQVWFCGAHSNIGGSYAPDKDGSLLSDNALEWMIKEAQKAGLTLEGHLQKGIKKNPLAKLHNSRRSFYRIKKTFYRPIEHNNGIEVLIHTSVKERWDKDSSYRPKNLRTYIKKNGWPAKLVN